MNIWNKAFVDTTHQFTNNFDIRTEIFANRENLQNPDVPEDDVHSVHQLGVFHLTG